MDYLMEKELVILIIKIDMKKNIEMGKQKEKGLIIIIMENGKEIDMKVSLKMIKQKEKGFIIIIEINMKENGEMIKKKEKMYIITVMVIVILEII